MGVFLALLYRFLCFSKLVTKLKNYYTILEIPESASAEMIKNAYRSLAKRWHPDVNPGDQVAEKMFMEVKEAYTTLSNAIKRNYYDYQLRKAILDKKVEPTTTTKVGSFRKKEQDSTKKTTSTQEKKEKEKDKVFHSSETYKTRLDDLLKKHNDLVEKQKKAAEANRKKEESEKSFYDTFRENRENSYFEQKLKKKEEQIQEKEKPEHATVDTEESVVKPQKNRIKAILSILGFRSD